MLLVCVCVCVGWGIVSPMRKENLEGVTNELKVLYSGIDSAKIRLIRKVVIKKREVRQFFYKNPLAPHPLRAL
jgi:hypothetical protein